MRMALVIGLCHSHFSYFCYDFKKWCRGDRSRTSLVPATRWSTVHPTMSVGELAVVTLGFPQLVVAPVLGVPGTGGTSQGATCIELVCTGPQLGDDAGSLL
jgi:hypothetical protein